MEEVLHNFTSPSWWITVVIFGLFIGLVSNYLHPFIEKKRAIFSENYRKKLNHRKSSKLNLINSLSENKKLREIYLYNLATTRFHSTMSSVFCIASSFASIHSSRSGNQSWGLFFMIMCGVIGLFAIYNLIDWKRKTTVVSQVHLRMVDEMFSDSKNDE